MWRGGRRHVRQAADVDPVADRWPIAIRRGEPRAIEALHDLLRDMAKSPSLGGRLTSRQLQVIRLYADGLEGPQVAVLLGISYETVRSHVKQIRGRLGARTITQAVAIACRHVLID